LADYFRFEHVEILEEGLLRYPKSILWTLGLLLRERPTILAVQNPSMILAAVAVIWGMVTPTFVIVDRHTTFLLDRQYRASPWLLTFKVLHQFTLRFADITVVTNDFLAGLVRTSGGTAYVLPDRLPSLDCSGVNPYPVYADARCVLLISSFADDEPVQAVLEAVSLVTQPSIHLYVSGSLQAAPDELVRSAPSNVTFTDYLSETDFCRLLHAADLVAVFTTADHTLLCGCYEAVAAERPLVTSDRHALRSYFRGAFFVDNTPAQIAGILSLSAQDLAGCSDRMRILKDNLRRTWAVQAAGLQSLMTDKG